MARASRRKVLEPCSLGEDERILSRVVFVPEQTTKRAGGGAKRMIWVSLSTDEVGTLDALVSLMRASGDPKASRSTVVRRALAWMSQS